MPVLLCKTSHTRCKAPEDQADDQPHLPVAIVGQESSEHPRQWVEIVEHRSCHNLIKQTFTVPPPSADGDVSAIVVKRHIW